MSLSARQGKLYVDLYRRIRNLILNGTWPEGTRLPATRVIADDLKISRNTASLAVQQLLADGWVESRGRIGIFVARSPALSIAAARRESDRELDGRLVPFQPGAAPSDLFPADSWSRIELAVWARLDLERAGRIPAVGNSALRDLLARLVCAGRGIDCSAADIIVTTSKAAALDITLMALADDCGPVLIEDPCCPHVETLLSLQRRTAMKMPVDNEGASLPDCASQAGIAIVSPGAQVRSGAVMTRDRQDELLDWAGSGGWIVELDDNSELRFDGHAPDVSLRARSERVISIVCMNQQLCPGLGLAFIVTPPALRERLQMAQEAKGAAAALASQLTLAQFIDEGHYAGFIRRRRHAVASRRARLLNLVRPLLTASDLEVAPAGLDLILNMDPSSEKAGLDSLWARGIQAESLWARRAFPHPGGGIVLGCAAFPELVMDHVERRILNPDEIGPFELSSAA